ncbi:MAG: DUF4203 domain-containing protein [bacterium]
MILSGTAGAVLAIALGAFICFFGYRLLRVTLAVAGFLCGAGLGWFVTAGISGIAPLVVVIVVLAAGALGAVLATLVYKVGVFLLGAGIGAMLALFAFAGGGGTAIWLVVAAVAVVFGLVTVFLERAMVTILSALAGAWGVALGAFHLAGWLDMNRGVEALAPLNVGAGRLPYIVGAWLFLAVLGMLAQFGQGRKRR